MLVERPVGDLDRLSEPQAAAALHAHPKTLARWRRAGVISYDRSPGGRISYRWEDLVAFRRSLHRPADAPICSHMSGESEAAFQ